MNKRVKWNTNVIEIIYPHDYNTIINKWVTWNKRIKNIKQHPINISKTNLLVCRNGKTFFNNKLDLFCHTNWKRNKFGLWKYGSIRSFIKPFSIKEREDWLSTKIFLEQLGNNKIIKLNQCCFCGKKHNSFKCSNVKYYSIKLNSDFYNLSNEEKFKKIIAKYIYLFIINYAWNWSNLENWNLISNNHFYEILDYWEQQIENRFKIEIDEKLINIVRNEMKKLKKYDIRELAKNILLNYTHIYNQYKSTDFEKDTINKLIISIYPIINKINNKYGLKLDDEHYNNKENIYFNYKIIIESLKEYSKKIYNDNKINFSWRISINLTNYYKESSILSKILMKFANFIEKNIIK